MEITYSVDDVPLNNAERGWFLEAETRLPGGPGRRVALVTAPYMHGAVPVRQGWDTGLVSVSVVVESDDGLVTAVSGLRSWLASAGRVSLTDGVLSLSNSVLQSVVADPEFLSERVAKVQAVFTVAPFWRVDADPVVFGPVFLSGGGTELAVFKGGTGPLVDAVVRVSGPSNGVTVTGRDGSSVVFPVLAAGEYGFVDLASRRGWVSASDSGWSGASMVREFVPDYGAGGWLEITPGPDGYVLSASGDMGSLVAVRAGRWFL